MANILIIKNISNYFKISPFVYLFAFLAVITASFIPFFIISFLIIIHELGHFLTAVLLNVEVDKIYLYPFGGISKINTTQNLNIFKEFLILLMGPIFQIIAYFILINILKDYDKVINTYHYGILIFNLLPIYPLDGGKILSLLFQINIPLKKSIYISLISSTIIILGIIFFNIKNLNLNIIIASIILLIKINKEYKEINYLYEKFLLERYLNKYNYKKSSLIKNPNNFYRNKRHLLKISGKYYLEKDFLEKKYKKC